MNTADLMYYSDPEAECIIKLLGGEMYGSMTFTND
jgi:hypothetical protein